MHTCAHTHTHNLNVLAAGGIETRLYESQLLFIPSDSAHILPLRYEGQELGSRFHAYLAAFVLEFKSDLITLIRLHSSAEILSEFSEARTEESYTPRPFLGVP